MRLDPIKNILEKKGKVILEDGDYTVVCKSVADAKDRAKQSWRVPITYWTYNKKDKAWYTNDGGVMAIKLIR